MGKPTPPNSLEPPPLPAWATRRAEPEPPIGPPPRRGPSLAAPSTVECPRCGYDLTPMLPAPGPGRDACATCSECGLTFTWNGLFAALRELLPWFVEHTKGVRLTALAIPWTLAWLALPHLFWRRITVERRVRMDRAFLWLALVPILRLSETLVVFLAYAYDGSSGGRIMNSLATVKNTLIDAFNVRDLGPWYEGASITSPPFMVSAVSAIMLVLLPWTRRQAKVRMRLVVRTWIYSNALLIAILAWNVLEISNAAIFGHQSYRGPSGLMSSRIHDMLLDAADARREGYHVILAFILAWHAWYWYSALRLGLRIKNAAMVALALLLPAALATLLYLLLSGNLPMDLLV